MILRYLLIIFNISQCLLDESLKLFIAWVLLESLFECFESLPNFVHAEQGIAFPEVRLYELGID